MNLLSLRTLLASWVQDTSNRQWDAAKCRQILNLACREVEKHILGFDPESFKATYTAATVVPAAGRDNIYSWPAGTFAVHELAISTDGVNYTPIHRRGLSTIREYRANGESESCFCPYSAGHFILYPSATTVIAAGLRAIVAPTLGLTDDTDEDPFPLAFETMLILEAKKLASYDTGEPSDPIQKEIDRLKTETTRFFLTQTEPMFIEPKLTRY